jgi:hypothetical protein
MPGPRFQCSEDQCDRYARVTIEDASGQRERVCPRHAVQALNGLAGARVLWDDTKGINEHEATALQLAEERSQLPPSRSWQHEYSRELPNERSRDHCP